eukprot:Clim_evm92s134 gene=Clim_evmTU92s134
MADAAKKKRWVPLESNPDVLNKYGKQLGLKSGNGYVDVYGLDPDLLAFVPQPVYAVMLLFPISENYENYRREEEEKINKEGQTVSDQVVFVRQYIGNACGTIGMLHGLLNCQEEVPQEGYLKDLKEKFEGKTAEERGDLLMADDELDKAHGEAGSEGQTSAPEAEEEVNLHFVTFSCVDGSIYELDGRKPFPINHGPSSRETFLNDAVEVIRKFIARDSDVPTFAITALTANME